MLVIESFIYFILNKRLFLDFDLWDSFQESF